MKRFPGQPVVAVGAVIVRDDNVVLIRRGQPPLQGAWSLPGGVVELGETLIEALVREVQEETGLTVTVGPVVAVLDRIDRMHDDRVEFHYVIIDYLCTASGGTLVSRSDAAEARWAHRATLADYELTPEANRVFHKALELASSGVMR